MKSALNIYFYLFIARVSLNVVSGACSSNVWQCVPNDEHGFFYVSMATPTQPPGGTVEPAPLIHTTCVF